MTELQDKRFRIVEGLAPRVSSPQTRDLPWARDTQARRVWWLCLAAVAAIVIGTIAGALT